MDWVISFEDDTDIRKSTKIVEAADHHIQNKTNNNLAAFLFSYVGARDFCSKEVWRAALTELVATTCLMFTLTSSIISCLDSKDNNPKILVPFAVFFIAFLFLMVTVPLSGGHMSPVFTFIATLKGLITLSRAFIYLLAQCIGSIMGFLIIKVVMDPNVANNYFLGGCSINGNGGASGLSAYTALLLEFSCTFVVLFVGVTIAFDKKRSKEVGLVVICIVIAMTMGLSVYVSITVTGRAGYAGVGLNPARCLGPALLIGKPLWDGHWVFWVGPFLACIVYYVLSVNLPKEGLDRVDGEYDVLKLTGGCFRGTSHSS